MKKDIPFNVGSGPTTGGEPIPPFEAILEGARAGKNGGFRNPRTWGTLALAAIIGAGLWVWQLGERGPEAPVLTEETTTMHQGPMADAWLPEAEIFTLPTDQSVYLQTADGVGLTVPSGVFATAADSVTVAITFYNEAFEVFASGIPMTYDSAGTTYHFQTDGMVRLEAFVAGEPTALLDGQTLSLEIPVRNDSTSFNDYRLNEGSGQWTYLKPSSPVSYAQACAERTPSSEPAASIRQSAPNTALLADIAALEIERRRLAKTAPVEPTPFNPNQDHFDLDVLAKEFPQLTSFAGMEFEVRGPGFRSEFFDQLWDDFTLTPIPDSPLYLATLKGDGKTREFKVVPVVRAAEFDAAFAAYQRKKDAHDTSKTACEEQLKQKQVALDAVASQAADRLDLQASASAMLMSNMVSEMDPGSLVYRMSIGSLGVCNVDKPVVLSTTRAVPVDVFVRHNNQVIRPIEATHCDMDRMQFYLLKGEELNALRWRTKAQNLMMTSLDGNQVFVVTPSQFQRIHKDAGEYQPLEMQVVRKPVKNMDELLRQLELSDTSIGLPDTP